MRRAETGSSGSSATSTRAPMQSALAEATVAVFPYAPELDQSGALLQALGAGVPAVVYDVGGLGEVVAAFGAGRVVPAGDVEALGAALGALLGDEAALATGALGRGAGARRAHLGRRRRLAPRPLRGAPVRFGRRSVFDELVERQLALFVEDDAELLEEAAEAEERWTKGGREEAEELYGDYQLVVDAIADRLLDIREAYAATLEPPAADSYRAAFTRRASKRFRRYASLLADLDETA